MLLIITPKTQGEFGHTTESLAERLCDAIYGRSASPSPAHQCPDESWIVNQNGNNYRLYPMPEQDGIKSWKLSCRYGVDAGLLAFINWKIGEVGV